MSFKNDCKPSAIGGETRAAMNFASARQVEEGAGAPRDPHLVGAVYPAPVDGRAALFYSRPHLSGRVQSPSYPGRSEGAGCWSGGNSRRWLSTIACATSTSLWPL